MNPKRIEIFRNDMACVIYRVMLRGRWGAPYEATTSYYLDSKYSEVNHLMRWAVKATGPRGYEIMSNWRHQD